MRKLNEKYSLAQLENELFEKDMKLREARELLKKRNKELWDYKLNPSETNLSQKSISQFDDTAEGYAR